MADVQAHTARLIALFVSCVLYGILLTTLVPCIRSLLFSPGHKIRFKPRHDIKFPIVIATILLFLTSTFSVVLAMQDIIDAFINYAGPGGALEFYNGLNTGWKHWMLAVEDAIQVIIGDGLLLYRCYVLYDRRWRAIIVPSITWMALAVMSIMSACREASLPAGKNLNDPTMLPFLSATLLLTFATSVITTYLIIRRLWKTEGRGDLLGTIQPHFLSRIAKIFFETGLVYTLSVIASLGVYLTGSNLEYVAALAMIHIIPITCNLLLIRVEGIDRSQMSKENSTSAPVLWRPPKFNSKAEDEVQIL
ncbi:hypothetical protein C8R44DRAFT_715352 [Mycena epipterygia]|nr:hypothetical protein C8R44DRAFT_715352 [Mycena epipterygia]